MSSQGALSQSRGRAMSHGLLAADAGPRPWHEPWAVQGHARGMGMGMGKNRSYGLG